MDVKEAAHLAKNHVSDLFGEEGVTNLGLEEVEYDDALDQWHITVGFSRPWDKLSVLAGTGILGTGRTYKVVIIDKDGKALAVKNRETAYAG
ncbi:MAG: hypothetical protein EXR07_13090 [Acetobacteraceae bacterium]|nr:hypothetical protein [Acetobacteraceae bacterium]